MKSNALCQCGSPRVELQQAAPHLQWRPLTAQDVNTLHQLHERIEAGDQVAFRTSLEECQEKLDRWINTGCQNICGIDAAGVMRAYAAVQVKPTGEPLTLLLEGGIDPLERGHGTGSAVVHWQLTASENIARDYDSPIRAEVIVDDAHETSTDLLIRHNFSPMSWFYELRRKVGQAQEQISTPAGISFVQYTPERAQNVLVVRNVTVGNYQGTISPEEWDEDLRYVVPEWSVLAIDSTNDRSPIVGYLLASRYEQDWASLGWQEAYVDQLAVHPEWRNRGIATSLLIHGIKAHGQAGLDYTALGVDTRVESSTFGLFTPLGFERDRYSIRYATMLDPTP